VHANSRAYFNHDPSAVIGLDKKDVKNV
ncbi:GDP-mannose mannosyl hydrolase, partial [Escherichia coli]|nr:GDP-mannose mannosyl hydrolase [Escherichia coli]